MTNNWIKNIPNDTSSAVCSEYYDWSDSRFQRFVQIGECFQIEHVNFVDEQNARHQFGNALINVFVHHFVDFHAKFICLRNVESHVFKLLENNNCGLESTTYR